ncbi:MAG: hypothetical protein WKF77_15580 [Planctomycetaceae bacterium]
MSQAQSSSDMIPTGSIILKNPSKNNFSIPNAGKFAAQNFPVGGATGVLYARRSADGISTRSSAESVLVPIHALDYHQVLKNHGASGKILEM